MWFLKGRPTHINVRALISSIAGGYQQTSLRFNIKAEEETTHDGKVWIGIAIPWAPHKPNGSVKFVDDKLLTLLEENSGNTEEIITIGESDVEVWERLRSLKTQPNIELVHVQELINWYLDDIGVVTLWVEPGKTYQLNYTHKIGSDSCLFLPTRLPVIISNSHKPKMDYKVWVVNGNTIDLAKHLTKEKYDPQLMNILKESQETLNCYSFKEWGWDEDTRISTENWESSDDDWSEEEQA